MSIFFKTTKDIFLIKLSALIIDFLVSISITRYLNPNNYGIYVLIFLIPSFITSLGSFGLGPSIIYHLGSRKINPTKVFASLILLAILLGTVYYLLINFVFIEFIDNFFVRGRFSLSLINFATLIIPISLTQKYLRKILQGMNKVKAYSFISNLFLSLLRLFFVFLVVFVFKTGLYGMILANLLINLIVTLAILYCFKYYNILKINDFGLLKKDEFSSIISFALKGHISSVLQKSNDQLIRLLCEPLLTSTQFGFISIALKLSSTLLIGIKTLQDILLPKISQMKINEIKKTLPTLTSFSLLFTSIGAICLAIILPKTIFFFYGSDYEQVSKICYFLLPGILFQSIYKIYNLTLNQMGFPFLTTLTRSSGLIVNLIMVYFLVIRFQEIGYSIALSTSYFFMLITSYYLLSKKIDLSIYETFKFKINDLKMIKK